MKYPKYPKYWREREINQTEKNEWTSYLSRAEERKKEWERSSGSRLRAIIDRLTGDVGQIQEGRPISSPWPGRFARVRHIFSQSSLRHFFRYLFLSYLPPFTPSNQRTNEQRTRERKGSRLSLLFERHTEEEDEAPPIYRRRLTIRLGFDTVEWPSSNSKPNPSSSPPPCYRSRHCFHVRTQKLDDAHIIIITDEGGIRNRLRLFLWLEILLPRFIRVKNIFDYPYFFFKFFLRSTSSSLSILMLDTNSMKSYTGMWIKRQFD